MVSSLHFVITTLLTIACAKAIGVSDGDISVLALAFLLYGCYRAKEPADWYCLQVCYATDSLCPINPFLFL